jgi:radical SAM/Cys-rich protein
MLQRQSCTKGNRFDALTCQGSTGLEAIDIDTMQVNVGLRCNQVCVHCHLECSPARAEVMDWETMEAVQAGALRAGASLVDITGGAAEMNPHIRRFIASLRQVNLAVQVRTNLTVLLEPDQKGMMNFLADHAVGLVASLPCYLEENVNAQCGPAVYEHSVEALAKLNALGYGIEGGLQLNLVYNPAGPTLPGPQAQLEQDYRRELRDRFDIGFTRLLTITNMPLGRFAKRLRADGRLGEYEQLLEKSFNADTLPGLMCRHQVSVGWDGRVYDCDFNLALGLEVDIATGTHISRFDPEVFRRRRIVTGDHCLSWCIVFSVLSLFLNKFHHAGRSATGCAS